MIEPGGVPLPPTGLAPHDWQRLDRRMLLVHPVRELWRFLPVLLGLLIAGGASGGGMWWSGLAVGVPVVLGIVRYLTTTYRITDHRVELRRGLLQRHSLSTPVDRVRTVDLTASPVHRLLGLATVVVGTGSAASDADERLELDALPRAEADVLRARLLRAATPASPPLAVDAVLGDGAPAAPYGTGPQDTGAHGGALQHGTTPYDAAPEVPEEEIARFTPGWLRFAPFSGTTLVAAGAVVGVGAQFAEFVDVRVSEDDLARLSAFVTWIAAAAVVVAAGLSVAGYLVVNGGYRLTRHGATWRIRRGLLTHRDTGIDVARLAGLTIGEPATLRLARGRRLSSIVTGLGHDDSTGDLLLPPAPTAVAHRTAARVLGTAAPVTGDLREHGRPATIRRYSRALQGAAPFVAAAVVAIALGASAWLLVPAAASVAIALALAGDRARALGHGFLDGHVVLRSGSLLRHRDALAAPHVIGWTWRATWFQRRAGLATLSATTAGGGGRVHVPDIPDDDGVALARAATPGLIEPFLELR